MPAWAPDWPKTLFAVLIGTLALGRAWSALRPGSRAAVLVDRVRRLPHSRQIILSVVAVAGFLMIAEDVLEREQGELLLRMDHAVLDGARVARAWPGVKDMARVVSRLTGEGLVAAVLTGTAFLLAVRRRRDALIVLAGSLGAWVLAAALKMGLGVFRPTAHLSRHEISGYGFPSSHTLVALVVCGLLAWAIGKDCTVRVRALTYGGAVAVAVLAGVARIVLNAHWTSDVLAAFAIGTVWLNVVIAVASWPRVGARG